MQLEIEYLISNLEEIKKNVNKLINELKVIKAKLYKDFISNILKVLQ